MNGLLYLLLSSVILAILSGCTQDYNDGDIYPTTYSLDISFVTKSGINLVNNVSYDPSTGVITSWDFHKTVKDIDGVSTGKSYSGTNSLTMTTNNNGDRLLHLYENTSSYVSPEIVVTMRCGDIFGDKDEHILATYWSGKPNEGPAECNSVSFDGREYSVTYNKETFRYEVVITLDLP